MTTNADHVELEGLLRLRYAEIDELKAKIERLLDLLHRWHVYYSYDEESDLAEETRAALEGKT